MPDGQSVIVGRERFEAPEILFTPSLLEMEGEGIAEMIFKSIRECDMDVQKQLAANIILSGGTTMIPGLSSRMEKEIKDLYVERLFKGDRSGLDRVTVQVHDPPRRRHGVYMGASFLSKIAPAERFVSKSEHDVFASIVDCNDYHF